jgi:stearoyl-CoA desaturase (delta-9 desaturase)
MGPVFIVNIARNVETADDPHSPQISGIALCFFGVLPIYTESKVKIRRPLANMVMELRMIGLREISTPKSQWQGVGLMMMIDLFLFGAYGGLIWAIQMMWIPVTAAGIINGIGHYLGYRNYDCEDASRNIVPLWNFE